MFSSLLGAFHPSASLAIKIGLLLVLQQLHESDEQAFKSPLKSQNLCIANGLDALREMKDIKRLKATFDLDSGKVYYRLKFCKKFSMCFASSIDHTPVNEDIVNKIESWAKIIQVIQGKGRFMPYLKDTHSKEYGGPRDYYNCTGRFYIITHKTSPLDISNMKKNMQTNRCLSNQLCTRTCLHKTEKRNRCHEVRIVCNFKCSKESKRTRRLIQKPNSEINEGPEYEETWT
eukprot:gene18157-19969_t